MNVTMPKRPNPTNAIIAPLHTEFQTAAPEITVACVSSIVGAAVGGARFGSVGGMPRLVGVLNVIAVAGRGVALGGCRINGVAVSPSVGTGVALGGSGRVGSAVGV